MYLLTTKGNIMKEDMKKGVKHTSNHCGEFLILQYNSFSDVLVKFTKTGYIKVTHSSSIRNGAVYDPLFPNVYGVGFLGEGKFTTRKDGKLSKLYITWTSMIGRCYSEDYLKRYPTYQGCSVCEDWLDFQNFAKWVCTQYKDGIIPKGIHLDKDVLIKGNKVYSPLTCKFITGSENAIEAGSKNYSFISPNGVQYDIYNLTEFCNKNNLTPTTMCRVHSGKSPHHKQWRKAT